MKPLNKVFLSSLAILYLSSCAISEEEAAARDSRNNYPTDAEVEQYNASVDPSEHIVCRNEKPVGSHIPIRVCRKVADLDETTRHHRSELRRALR